MRRRDFIKGVTAGAAALSGATALTNRAVLGANERVRVGLIGCGDRGQQVAKLMRDVAGAEFAAVCDVYEPNAAAARAWAGPSARTFKDFRKLLNDNNLDAVLVATPDHWHAPVTVLACQAGKDVYVEKPLAHNIREGRAMVTAARRYDRVVQTGTQHRSAAHYREVERIIRSGELGEVRFVRVWNYANLTPQGISRVSDSIAPAGLDWDFYLGPAPLVPFNRNRFLRTYRYFWDYAGGMMTDFGTHRLDTVQQVMGVDRPRSVSAAGGRFTLQDNGEVPDLLQVTYEYPGFILSYETSSLNAHGMGGRTPGVAYYQARGPSDRPHGEAFYGTNGTILSDRIGFELYPEPLPAKSWREPITGYRMPAKQMAGKDATDLHVKEFIECVRTRRRPNADVEIGHRSTAAAHLGNIAYRTRGKLIWDGEKEDFAGDPQASALVGRRYRKPWDLLNA